MDVSDEVLVVLGAVLLLIGTILMLQAARIGYPLRPKPMKDTLARQVELMVRAIPFIYVAGSAMALIAIGGILAGVGLGWVDF